MLPIPTVPHLPVDPVTTYKTLLVASPTTSPNQPLLTVTKGRTQSVVTITMLSQALKVLLEALHMDSSLFSLHRLRRGGATTAYRAGIDQIHIKCHGMWANTEFWTYITSPSVSDSPVAAPLAAVRHLQAIHPLTSSTCKEGSLGKTVFEVNPFHTLIMFMSVY